MSGWEGDGWSILRAGLEHCWAPRGDEGGGGWAGGGILSCTLLLFLRPKHRIGIALPSRPRVPKEDVNRSVLMLKLDGILGRGKILHKTVCGCQTG